MMKITLVILTIIAIIISNGCTKETELDSLFNRGLSSIEQGDYEKAVENFDKVIELKPNYAMAFENRADAKIHLNNYPGAIRDYDRAIDLYGEYSLESKKVFEKRFQCEIAFERKDISESSVE